MTSHHPAIGMDLDGAARDIRQEAEQVFREHQASPLAAELYFALVQNPNPPEAAVLHIRAAIAEIKRGAA